MAAERAIIIVRKGRGNFGSALLTCSMSARIVIGVTAVVRNNYYHSKTIKRIEKKENVYCSTLFTRPSCGVVAVRACGK